MAIWVARGDFWRGSWRAEWRVEERSRGGRPRGGMGREGRGDDAGGELDGGGACGRRGADDDRGDGGGVLARRRRGTRRRRVATAMDEVWTWREGQLDGEGEGMEVAAGSSPEMESGGEIGGEGVIVGEMDGEPREIGDLQGRVWLVEGRAGGGLPEIGEGLAGGEVGDGRRWRWGWRWR